jgi:hypothetical protein
VQRNNSDKHLLNTCLVTYSHRHAEIFPDIDRARY